MLEPKYADDKFEMIDGCVTNIRKWSPTSRCSQHQVSLFKQMEIILGLIGLLNNLEILMPKKHSQRIQVNLWEIHESDKFSCDRAKRHFLSSLSLKVLKTAVLRLN